jgi:hypothetical protein
MPENLGKIPTTIIIDPIAVRPLIFSRGRKKPANVEKRGLLKISEQPRDCAIITKLYADKNHPRPSATIPPSTKVTMVFFGTFRKPNFRSIRAERF